MEKKIVNPWTWQDQFGFVQAVDTKGAQRVVYCAGQTSVDENGVPLHAGDMRAQVGQALDNLETVLEKADLNLSNVVRLSIYTTDVDALISVMDVSVTRLAEGNCNAAQTLLGVARLAFPDLMVELEATAVA